MVIQEKIHKIDLNTLQVIEMPHSIFYNFLQYEEQYISIIQKSTSLAEGMIFLLILLEILRIIKWKSKAK